MRLDQAAIVLRSRGLLGSADLAFRFVFSVRKRLWLGLFALTLLPAWIGCTVLRYGLDLDWALLWLFAISYGSVAQGIFCTAAGLLMFDQETPLSSILRHYGKKLLPHAVCVAFTRCLAVALLPIFGAGLFVWVRWAFVHEAILLEQASLTRAPRRSAEFVKHQAENGFVLLLLLIGLNLLVAINFEGLGQGLEELLLLPIRLESLVDEGGSAYALLGYFVSLPLCAIVRFLAYIDSRTRRDGWDIQVRFMALAAEGESALAARGVTP